MMIIFVLLHVYRSKNIILNLVAGIHTIMIHFLKKLLNKKKELIDWKRKLYFLHKLSAHTAEQYKIIFYLIATEMKSIMVSIGPKNGDFILRNVQLYSKVEKEKINHAINHVGKNIVVLHFKSVKKQSSKTYCKAILKTGKRKGETCGLRARKKIGKKWFPYQFCGRTSSKNYYKNHPPSFHK